MSASRSGALLSHLRNLACRPDVGRLPDPELLCRFVAGRDEDAFAALVQRYGGLVFAVCRSVLRHRHDAEDVLQATFLVLARKAGSIRSQTSVGSWLHGVAYRLALKARGQAVRRGARSPASAPSDPPDPLDDLTLREAREVLHEEVQRLPERYRAALLLCYWEGLTHAEAARRLSWKKGTLKEVVERARALLRCRLSRRGLAPVAVLPAALLVPRSAFAVSPALVRSLSRAAPAFAAGEPISVASASALALARGVLTPTPLGRLTSAMTLLLAVALAGGVALAARQRPADEPDPPRQEVRQPQPPEREKATTDAHGDPLPEGALARLGTVRFRHGGPISGVAFAPDGRWLASSGSDDQIVRLWDPVTGKELRRLTGHTHYVQCVAVSPDGRVIATGGHFDPSVRLWDAASGKELRRLDGHREVVWAVAFAPDGKALVSASEDGTLRVWETATGKELQRIACATGVRAASFSRDGKSVLSAGADGSIRVWDGVTGKEQLRLDGHTGSTRCLAVSPDGRTLISGGDDKLVRLWDLTAGKEVHRLKGHRDGVASVAFSPDGKLLASGGSDQTVRLWHADTGKDAGTLKGHEHVVCSVAFSPDGKLLASAGYDNIVRLWDVAAAKEVNPYGGHQGSAKAVAYAPNGKLLATGGFDGVIRLWDAVSGEERARLTGHTEVVAHLAFSPDGKTLASASYDSTVRLWDVTGGKEVRKITAHREWVTGLAFAPDGKTLASGSFDGTAAVWDTATGRELRRHDVGQRIHGVAFSPDGKSLAVGFGGPAVVEGGLRLLDPNTGKEQRRIDDAGGIVNAVAFSPDGRTLASGSYDGVVRLWDLATGSELRQLIGHKQYVESVAFSGDGRVVVSASYDRTVRLWEVATGQERRQFDGHQGGVYAVAFEPDGATVASASWDTTVTLWQAFPRAGKRERRFADGQADKLWAGLSADAAAASAAVRELAAAPRQTAELLGKRLRPAVAPDRELTKRLEGWLADLDSEDFGVRDKALEALERQGEMAEAALGKALKGRPSLDVRRRIERLLDRLGGDGTTVPADRLRLLRAVELLEYLDTAEARRLLKALAGGAPGAVLTQQAEAALGRLAKRSGTP
jgi:RNA polymerase sigma factor (sigma-70 family)